MKIQLATLIIAVVLTPMSSAQFTIDDIPIGLRNHASSDHIRRAYQSGIIKCDALASRVFITWTASAIENQMPDPTLVWDQDNMAMGNNVIQKSVQEFGTDFYPTAACVINSEELLIGGVYKDGTTVIERWTLKWPDTNLEVAINIQTGLKRVGVSHVKRSLKKTIYKGDTVGKKLIQTLIALRKASGAITSYLVQFADSSDVHSSSIDGGPFTLVGSATSAAGTLGVVQGLQGDTQTGLIFGNRTDVGNVYTFMMTTPAGGAMQEIDPPYALYVLLIDTDRNGTIDTFLQPSAFEWLSQGWADLNNYTEWWID